jgi:hypothetical protein
VNRAVSIDGFEADRVGGAEPDGSNAGVRRPRGRVSLPANGVAVGNAVGQRDCFASRLRERSRRRRCEASVGRTADPRSVVVRSIVVRSTTRDQRGADRSPCRSRHMRARRRARRRFRFGRTSGRCVPHRRTELGDNGTVGVLGRTGRDHPRYTVPNGTGTLGRSRRNEQCLAGREAGRFAFVFAPAVGRPAIVVASRPPRFGRFEFQFALDNVQQFLVVEAVMITPRGAVRPAERYRR